jgi:uncharacterized ferritin-like protein (DUF455 family)
LAASESPPAVSPKDSPELFAPGPVRDSRFTVKETWGECDNFPVDASERLMEFMHRQMSEEVDGMECAAQMLVDFPDAPWDLKMQIARQISDEARHVLMFKKLYSDRGGELGKYPIMTFQFRIITMLPTIEGRLGVQNRLFEAEGVDAVEPEIVAARERGDEEMARLFEAQLADEICHVRYANEYIRRATKENPIKVIQIGQAMGQASTAFQRVMGQQAIESVRYQTNEKGREEAGFTADEIAYATKLKSGAIDAPGG